MGLPARSPISDRFQGTIYMTFGCSRSPVTVAVPRSNRSILLGADFWPDPPPGAPAERPSDAGAAGARPVVGARSAGGAADGAADGAGVADDLGVAEGLGVADGAGAVVGAFDVSA